MRKSYKIIIFLLITGACIFAPLLLSVNTSQADNEILWGVNFSESQAIYLGLDPEETYSAIINELGAKYIKLHINWNATEPINDEFDFYSLDRQVNEAEDNDVKLTLVIGMKTGRWPECHTPAWFENVSEDKRQEEIVTYVQTIVERYKHSEAIQYWQIENEPFLEFGTCPTYYYDTNQELLEAEVAAVRALDPYRKIIISESGELSDWTSAAKLADIVGVTMYRSSWNATQETFGVNPYSFLTPQFYSAKAEIIKRYYKKPVISIELQAEPWTAKPLAESSLEVQAMSMNPELFQENIEFAKQAKLGAYYFWGAEWWYWMKTVHDQPEIWDAATAVFTE